MKSIKKIFAVIIAMTMALMLALPAFAEVVSVDNGSNQSISGHTFDFYQVFKGTLSGDSLTSIEWGNGVTDDIKTNTDLKSLIGKGSEATFTATDVATWLTATPSEGELTTAQRAEKFAKLAEQYKSTTKAATNVTASVTLAGAGYYLIVDSTQQTALGTSARNPAVLMQSKTAGGTYTIKSKTNIPTVEKKIWEESLDATKSANGAASTTITPFADGSDKLGANQWNDVGDYDIGDAVPFKLTATVPADTMTNYTDYHITFNDTYATGFDTPTGFKYYYQIGTGTITEVPYAAISNTPGSNGFTAKIQMVGTNGIIAEADKANAVTVYVVYTAVLNSKAATAVGQENTVFLTYSNDYTSTGTGKTPDDTVVAMTFDFDVNKYNSATPTEKLAASFKLYKVTGTTTPSGDALKTSKQGDIFDLTTKTGLTEMKFTQSGTTYTAGGTTAIFTTDTSNQIVLHGLDTGDYILVETAAPDGYNILDKGVLVTIATTDYTRDNYITGGYTGTNAPKTYTVNTVTNSATDPIPTVAVANNKGATLPSTGGMGTTLFTILGIALMAGAAVLLVAKRRANK